MRTSGCPEFEPRTITLEARDLNNCSIKLVERLLSLRAVYYRDKLVPRTDYQKFCQGDNAYGY